MSGVGSGLREVGQGVLAEGREVLESVGIYDGRRDGGITRRGWQVGLAKLASHRNFWAVA